MKHFSFIFILSIFIVITACDRELKEHPMPIEIKRQLTQANLPPDPEHEIAGIVTIPDKLANSAPKDGVLFLVARPEGVTSGPPVAAKRHSLVSFPFEFNLGARDVMRPGVKFEGKMTITARLDHDGVADSSAGDIFGSIVASPGEINQEISLDQVVTAQPAAATNVTGTIALDPQFEGKTPDSGILFIFARPQGVRRGPPLAVKRVRDVKFPYTFEIGQEDTMMEGSLFDGNLTLTARLDGDGVAGAGPGDLEASVNATAGTKGIQMTLSAPTIQ